MKQFVKKAAVMIGIGLVVLVVLHFLPGCTAPGVQYSAPVVTDNGNTFEITQISSRHDRLIDRELGIVCYSRYDGGIFCMKYEEE